MTPTEKSELREALRVVLANGFTPVIATGYERLCAWLDATDGWPPENWQVGGDRDCD